MMREQPAARQASTTAQTIGRPPTGCTTLGRSPFIRMPLPAARMIAIGAVGLSALGLIDVWRRERGDRARAAADRGTGRPGFEPGQTEPKSAVLPLHHRPEKFAVDAGLHTLVIRQRRSTG